MLHTPTAEQRRVVDLVLRGNNVKVCAVAGSGKSTTMIHCLKGLIPSEQCALIVSYSKDLQSTTLDRITRCDLREVCDVRTIHSLGCSLYGSLCRKDQGLREVVLGDLPLRSGAVIPRPYDIIFIDEAQDITPTLFNFLLKAVQDLVRGGHLKCVPIWGVFGDVSQCIYQYKKSDPRYLTQCDRMLPASGVWAGLTLRETFRLNRNMANFMNKGIARSGEAGELEFKCPPEREPGRKVQYYRGIAFTSVLTIAKDLVRRLRSGELVPDDILIISPSVKINTHADKSHSPLQVLSNYLSNPKYAGGLVFPQMCKSDDDMVGENPKGKILIATRHASKGLERRVVVVVGFCQSYYRFFGKEEARDVCSQAWLVALTRGSQELHIVGEAVQGDQMRFLDLKRASEHVEIVGDWVASPKAEPTERSKSFLVSQLVSQVMPEVLERAQTLIEPLWVRRAPPSECLQLPSEVFDSKGCSFSVSHLTGIAIPTMLHIGERGVNTWPHIKGDFPFVLTFASLERWLHEKRLLKQGSLGGAKHFEVLMDEVLKLQEFKRGLENAFKGGEGAAVAVAVAVGVGGGEGEGSAGSLPSPPPLPFDYPPEFYLRCAGLWNVADSINSGYNCQYLNIPKWDWLEEGMARTCKERLRAGVEGWEDPSTAVNEVLVYSHNNGEWEVRAELDVSTPTAVYELKVADTLTPEYQIQLALYAYLWLKVGKRGPGGGIKAFRLFNIKSGECLELALTDESGGVVEAVERALWDCLRLLVDNKLEPSADAQQDDAFVSQHAKGIAGVIKAASEKGIGGVSVVVGKVEAQTVVGVNHFPPTSPPMSPIRPSSLEFGGGGGGGGGGKRPREDGSNAFSC